MIDSGLNIGAGSEFFDDQIIYKEDLQNIEYTKIKTIRDTIAVCISQPGVAIDSLTDTALQVVYVDNAHFTVNPGTAIDKYGRIIYVPDDVSVYGNFVDSDYHPQWPDRENIAHGQSPTVTTRYYVNIYYATQQDIVEADDLGISYYTRIYDSYRIEVENFEAGSGSFGDGGICLASFQVNSLGEIIYSIGDLRSILQMRTSMTISSASIGARDIYNEINIATEVLNNVTNPNRFSVSNSTYTIVQYSSYMHRGQDLVNTQFCVPIYSDPGTFRVQFAYGSGGVFYNYSYTTPGVYNFSDDIVSYLASGELYLIILWLKKDATNTTYVRDVVIDVS